jgi:hypothetical protein
MNRAGVTSIVYAGTSSRALRAFTDCRAQHKRLGTEWRSALIERSEDVLPKKAMRTARVEVSRVNGISLWKRGWKRGCDAAKENSHVVYYSETGVDSMLQA